MDKINSLYPMFVVLLYSAVIGKFLLFISFFSLHIINDKNPILNELHIMLLLLRIKLILLKMTTILLRPPPLPPRYNLSYFFYLCYLLLFAIPVYWADLFLTWSPHFPNREGWAYANYNILYLNAVHPVMCKGWHFTCEYICIAASIQ